MSVPTPKEDLHPDQPKPKWRLRVLQGVSIAGPGVLAAFMPAVGTPLLVVTAVIAVWVEYGRK